MPKIWQSDQGNYFYKQTIIHIAVLLIFQYFKSREFQQILPKYQISYINVCKDCLTSTKYVAVIITKHECFIEKIWVDKCQLFKIKCSLNLIIQYITKFPNWFLACITKNVHIIFRIFVFHLHFPFGGDHLRRFLSIHFRRWIGKIYYSSSLSDCYFSYGTFQKAAQIPCWLSWPTTLKTLTSSSDGTLPSDKGFFPNYENICIIIFFLKFIGSDLVT